MLWTVYFSHVPPEINYCFFFLTSRMYLYLCVNPQHLTVFDTQIHWMDNFHSVKIQGSFIVVEGFGCFKYLNYFKHNDGSKQTVKSLCWKSLGISFFWEDSFGSLKKQGTDIYSLLLQEVGNIQILLYLRRNCLYFWSFLRYLGNS